MICSVFSHLYAAEYTDMSDAVTKSLEAQQSMLKEVIKHRLQTVADA